MFQDFLGQKTNMAEFQDSLPLRELIVNSETNELFYDGNIDGERVICWTRISNDGATFILAASNGFDIWRATYEKQDLIAQWQCEMNNLEKFLYIIKYAFESCSVSLVKVGNKIILQCSGQKSTLNFDLFEAKINDKKAELHYMMFHLTDKVKELKRALTDANDALEIGRQKEKHGSTTTQGFGFEPVRKGGASVNLRRKQQGSSLVNPNSKKAKRAKGINFE